MWPRLSIARALEKDRVLLADGCCVGLLGYYRVTGGPGLANRVRRLARPTSLEIT